MIRRRLIKNINNILIVILGNFLDFATGWGSRSSTWPTHPVPTHRPVPTPLSPPARHYTPPPCPNTRQVRRQKRRTNSPRGRPWSPSTTVYLSHRTPPGAGLTRRAPARGSGGPGAVHGASGCAAHLQVSQNALQESCRVPPPFTDVSATAHAQPAPPGAGPRGSGRACGYACVLRRSVGSGAD